MATNNTREIETRATPSAVELRSARSSRRVGGLAAVFGKRSQPLTGYVEMVERSAFSKMAGDGWNAVMARYEHRDLLGTTAAGTLQLEILTQGLDYTVDCPETSAGNDVLTLTSRGDLRNSSFAFQVFDDDFTYDGGSLPVRHLISVRLIDVSPVSTPAYPDATVGLRSLAAHYDTDPEHVFTMARENRLLDLFVRTDNRRPVKPATPLRCGAAPKTS